MQRISVKDEGNWHINLASAIAQIEENGEIVVTSENKKELALRAIARMRPRDDIKVVVQ